jgi:hypothetical protein
MGSKGVLCDSSFLKEPSFLVFDISNFIWRFFELGFEHKFSNSKPFGSKFIITFLKLKNLSAQLKD